MSLFLGVDLAWGDVNETGVVALAEDGTILDADWTRGPDATVAWIDGWRAKDQEILCFVDAPLVVNNASGQRLCETEVGQRLGAALVSCNSTNTSSPRLGGIGLRIRLEARGWIYADGTNGSPSSGLVLMECYPYATIVGAAELGYTMRPTYKRPPRNMLMGAFRPIRAAAFDELHARLGALASATPPLLLDSHTRVRGLVPAPLADAAYKHGEDLLDATIAAWTASLWHCRPDDCVVYGASDTSLGTEGQRATIVGPRRGAAAG